MVAYISWWAFYSWAQTWIACKNGIMYTEESFRYLNKNHMILIAFVLASFFSIVVYFGIKELSERWKK